MLVKKTIDYKNGIILLHGFFYCGEDDRINHAIPTISKENDIYNKDPPYSFGWPHSKSSSVFRAAFFLALVIQTLFLTIDLLVFSSHGQTCVSHVFPLYELFCVEHSFVALCCYWVCVLIETSLLPFSGSSSSINVLDPHSVPKS